MPFKPAKIMFWNAQGITNISKQIQLEHMIETQKIDILLLAETFLKPKHVLKFSNYTVYRNDRVSQAHGGVAIAIRSTLPHKIFTPAHTKTIENLSIELNLNNTPTCITTAYCPRYSIHFANDISAISSRATQSLVFGDFNARHTSWNCVSNNKAGTVLFGIQQTLPLLIYHTAEHTHFPHSGQTPSTIDLLLSNVNFPFELDTHPNHISSDHAPIICQTQLNMASNRRKMLNYRGADWNGFRRFLDTHTLEPPSSPASIDSQIERFSALILQARDRFVPEVVRKNKFEISQQTRQFIQHKNSMKRQWQRTNDESRKAALKRDINRLQRDINAKVKEEFNKFWSSQLRSIQKGDKKLWNISKKIRGKVDTCTSKITIASTQSVDDRDRANCLAKIFERAHTLTTTLTHVNDAYVNATINAFHIFPRTSGTIPRIEYDDVSRVLAALKPFKSPGPDTIQNVLLKQLPRSSVNWLCDTLNLCIKLGHWPSSFKIAKVIPILKSGKPASDPSSYRPISLLNAAGKILERIVERRLTAFAEEKNLLPDFQFGFRRGHSTTHQAARIKQFIINEKTKKKSTGMVLLDVEKAFDSIWHDGLIFKLLRMKVPAYLVKLIEAFPRGRKFAVHVNGAKSSEMSIPAGLAQGTCLSPTLYALYVADIPGGNDSTQLALFADDTAVYTSARNSNVIVGRLNKSLVELQQYFHKWKIKINTTKTHAIIFPYNNSRRRIPTIPIRSDDHSVELAKTVNYLGVIFDQKLRYGEHILNAINKTNRCFGALYPLIASKSRLSIDNKQLLFKAVLRPIMAYGCPIWSSAAVTHVGKLSVLQNKILKTIHGLPRRTPTTFLESITGVVPFTKFIEALNTKFFDNCAYSYFEQIRLIVRQHI